MIMIITIPFKHSIYIYIYYDSKLKAIEIRQEYLSYSLTNSIPSWLVCAEIEVDNGPVQEIF